MILDNVKKFALVIDKYALTVEVKEREDQENATEAEVFKIRRVSRSD